MATVVKTIGIIGIHGYSIDVQVKVLGQSVMNIVGLGDQAVNEAKDRIESACDHLGFIFPKKKIIVNLFPLRHHFWIRNKWLACLSDQVIVTEAPARSGALITAEHALAQGKKYIQSNLKRTQSVAPVISTC